jgi:hypothetical protein
MEPHAGHAAGASARRERAVLGLPLLAPAVALRQRPVGVVRVLGQLHAWRATPRVSEARAPTSSVLYESIAERMY